jgi:hypothetical protein
MSGALPPRTRGKGLERKGGCTTLFFCASLGMQGVSLDVRRFFGVCPTMTWWFVFRNHKHPAEDGVRVVGGDVNPDLLKLAAVRRLGSSCTAAGLLLVDPFPHATSVESMPCTLMVGSRYV